MTRGKIFLFGFFYALSNSILLEKIEASEENRGQDK